MNLHQRLVKAAASAIGLTGRGALGLFFALATLPPSLVSAAQYSVEGRTLICTPDEGEPVKLDLPCQGRALLSHEDRLYIACGADGVLVVDVSVPTAPREVERRRMEGVVTGFFVLEDAVWVRIQRLEARPFDESSALGEVDTNTPPSSPTETVDPGKESPGEAQQPLEAEVLELRQADVVVGLGAEQGVARGDRMEIFLRRGVDIGAGEQAAEEKLVLVGRVKAVSPNRSTIQLGVNERVPPGALARLTSKPVTSNRTSPPRVSDIWELEFTARPFLALGTLGAGTVSDATLRRRFESTWSVEARLEPMSFGIADEGNIVSLAGNLIGSYDNRRFSVGLGLGRSVINDAVSDSVGQIGDRVITKDVSSALSLAQAARLGSRDGLHLAVYNTFLFYQDEFHYGGTVATLQFSVSDGLWFIARGGGGKAAGYAFGEIGLRVLLRGSGDRGSFYLSPSVGGGGLFKEKSCDEFDGCTTSVSYGGPLVGLGLEWRR